MTIVDLRRIAHSEESDESSGLLERRTHLSASAIEWLHKSVPKETFNAYSREWFEKFLPWCEAYDVSPLPVTSDNLASWVASRCDAGNSVSAIEQGISAVVFFHDGAKVRKPNRDDSWRIVGAYRRQLIRSGWRPDEAATYTAEQLRTMSATQAYKGALTIRDRAALLTATGAFARRSEVVGLDIGDIRFANGKLIVFVALSKTDQQGRGRDVDIAPGAHPLSDAVAAMREWVNVLSSKGIRSGPLFRQMRKTSFGYRILDYRLDGRWVGRIVKEAVREAGITAPSGRTYRAHSTRASGATMAFRARKPTVQIAEHGGWSLKGTQVHKYNRPEDQESVTEGLM